MGIVSNKIAELLQRQVDRKGLVVWFDPERHYEDSIDRLRLDGVRLERHCGSFLELRRRIEPALAGDEPPRLVVYVPMAEVATRGALVEAIAAGVVVRPGGYSQATNSKLAVVARAALRAVFPDDAVAKIERQIEAGQLGLAELDQLAERGRDAGAGSLVLMFGSTSPADVALSFLADVDLDAKLEERGVLGDLGALLATTYDANFEGIDSARQMRRGFARHILATDLAEALGDELPAPLVGVPRARDRAAIEATLSLARAWRNRRDVQQSYVELADLVERDLALSGPVVESAVLEHTETFRLGEMTLLRRLERTLLEQATDTEAQLAELRQATFWASAVPEIMERWALLATICRLLLACDRVDKESAAAIDAEAFVRHYTTDAESGAEAWCLLDTHHRHMERRVHHLDPSSLDGDLERLVALARARYTAALSVLADRFLHALQAAGFRVPKVPRQTETFSRFVAPRLGPQRVAYILVDALRYEMAAELRAGLGRDFQVELACVLGTLPSITEIGMAALLPGADQDTELVDAGRGRVALRIQGEVVVTRAERMAVLAGRASSKFVDTKLEALLPPSKRTREQIAAADFAVITATEELDGLCEKGNVAMARRLLDDVLLQLRRALGVLFDLGVEVAVITADHGFLFGEEIDGGLKIDPPGGKTVDLHRRVWVGKGGARSESYVRIAAKDIGLGGDLELAVPKSIGCFKMSGAATPYFHGGASPQELLVPVLTVERARPTRLPSSDNIWTLTLGSKTISTRVVSVQIEGRAGGLFEAVAPTVRVEVREGRERRSRAVAASYGFDEATGDVQLALGDDRRTVRPVTLTLMLDEIRGSSVTVVLVDASTERVLGTVEKVDVSIVAF